MYFATKQNKLINLEQSEGQNAHKIDGVLCLVALNRFCNSVNKEWRYRRFCNFVRQLRFKPPEPPLKWKPKVRSAKRHGNVCWQGKAYEVRLKKFVHNFTYSEDCLFLDIYTPDVKSKLPVMFYIHGGSYEFGATVTFPGDILALHGVVVVITQYRLGSFAFSDYRGFCISW